MLLQRVDPSEAQEAARRILAERRFRPPDVPRPLEGFFDPLGRAARDAWEAVVEALDDLLPGPRAVVWTVLGVAVVLAAVGFAAWLSRRRAVRNADAPVGGPGPAGVDARRIEAMAAEAERAEDFASAIRLRFRAGLLRLEAAGRIRRAESTTSREVARRLRSPRFDHVAAIFDQVVYGGRPATAADAETSRAGWEALLRAAAEKRRT
jgi:hypothetical protein